MLVTSSESDRLCLAVSLSLSLRRLLNNLRKFWIRIKVTPLVSENIWLRGPHLQDADLTPSSQSLDPKPQIFGWMVPWWLKGQQQASEWDRGAERKDTGVTGA